MVTFQEGPLDELEGVGLTLGCDLFNVDEELGYAPEIASYKWLLLSSLGILLEISYCIECSVAEILFVW